MGLGQRVLSSLGPYMVSRCAMVGVSQTGVGVAERSHQHTQKQALKHAHCCKIPVYLVKRIRVQRGEMFTQRQTLQQRQHIIFLSSFRACSISHAVYSSLSCLTLCDPMDASTPGFPVFHYLLEFAKLMSIESVMPSNHLILCRPLLFLTSIFPSIRVFSSESALLG